MFPNLIYIHEGAFWPEIILPTFTFMMMMAGLSSTFYGYFRAPKLGFSQVVALDVGMLGIIFGVLGGRLFHVFFESWSFYKDDYSRIFEFWRGGFVSYGAFMGGGLAVIIYLLVRKLPFWKYADFIGLCLPLCVVSIRIGCLGAGCCYGHPTDFFIHIVFKHLYSAPGDPNYSGLPVHPTQIYEMLYGLGLFIFLNVYYFRKKFDGQIIMLFFMIYAFCRFFLEFLRGDRDRILYWNDSVSTGQIVSVLVFVLCGTIYFLRARTSQSQSVS